MSKYKIALDRGHGGEDPGAVSYATELELNTFVTRQLEEMLAQDDNYETTLTCDYDVGDTIAERASVANAYGADLVISNHFNAGGGNGWEVYPEVPRDTTHSRYGIYNGSNAFATILVTLMSDIQFLRGAEGIQHKYYGTDSYFGIVRLCNTPSVLIENAFVDTEIDIADFNTEEKCKKLSGKQYNAICTYFGTTPLYDCEGELINTPQESMLSDTSLDDKIIANTSNFKTRLVLEKYANPNETNTD